MSEPTIDFRKNPHIRLNVLTGEWILVSPQRAMRPWQGMASTVVQNRPEYDPYCYLCPGNLRAGGITNPSYSGCYAFTNDFSAVLEDTPAGSTNINDLLVAKSQSGICRVICFSPRHDLTLAQLREDEILKVIE